VFSGTELLGRLAMEKMLARLSTRRYQAGLEPVGEVIEANATSTSKSAVSRRFVAATEKALADLMAGDLSQLDLVALMVDGVHFAGHCCVVALGIGIDGTKHPLGLVEGSTENATLVRDLIVELRERGLGTTRPVLAGGRRVQSVAPSDHRRVRPPGHRQVPTAQDQERHRQAPRRSRFDRGQEDARRVPQHQRARGRG
jgi:hypothetical protein